MIQAIRKVIYIDQKKYGPQVTTLGNTTSHRGRILQLVINTALLSSVSKIRLKPGG